MGGELMYHDSESYQIVKKILLDSIPHVDVLKLRVEGDNLIAVNCQKKFFVFNEVAKDFLQLCDSKRKLREIINVLCEIYDVEKNILTDDLMDLVRDLQYKRILNMEVI